MKYEDFCTKCVYVFDISKIDILSKKAWKFSGNITVHWTNAPIFCDQIWGGKVQNMKKYNTFVIKLVKYWWFLVLIIIEGERSKTIRNKICLSSNS